MGVLVAADLCAVLNVLAGGRSSGADSGRVVELGAASALVTALDLGRESADEADDGEKGGDGELHIGGLVKKKLWRKDITRKGEENKSTRASRVKIRKKALEGELDG